MALHSQRNKEGYLLIENLHAPAPEPSTDPQIITPQEVVFESATATCAHCHAIVVLNPQRTRARGYCAKCDSYVCDNPVCSSECRPLNKLFDQLREQALKEQQNHG